MTRPSSYEDLRQLAEHPRHRDVSAIFQLEVIETDELDDNQHSHYPMYKVRTYGCAFTPTLEEAERLMRQDILYRKKMKETDDWMQDIFCYYISEKPLSMMHFKGELSYR